MFKKAVVQILFFIPFSLLAEQVHTTMAPAPREKAVKFEAIKAFLANPEKFINEEKDRFIEKLEKEDAEKARTVKAIFEKYEQKLKDLKAELDKNNANKTIDDLIKESKLRNELSQLETELAFIFSHRPDLSKIIELLKQRASWAQIKSEWMKLIDNLEDEKLKEELRQLIAGMDKLNKDFDDLKKEIQNKTSAQVTKEKLKELSDKSAEIRNWEGRLRNEITRIEKDLRERGVIHDVQVEFKKVELKFNQNKNEAQQELDRIKAEAEKKRKQLKGIFEKK